MKRLANCVTIFALAFLTLLFINGAVYSTRSTTSDPPPPPFDETRAVTSTARSFPSPWQRIVTITVGSSTDPLTPALNSLWEIENNGQNPGDHRYQIPLPSDAYDISVTLDGGTYSIEPGPLISITSVVPWYYLQFRTNQRALRIGGQILVTQTAFSNQGFRYISTLIFTEPYRYIGTSGYSPVSVTPSSIHWDVLPTHIPSIDRNRFDASTWLASSALTDTDKPDLEILTATLQAQAGFHQVRVSTVIQNHSVMTAPAPPYLNLYDYLAPSAVPTNPLAVDDSWCQLYPFTQCSDFTPNPLPQLGPGESITVTADYTLSPRSGNHYLYFLVDALGGSLGQNWESNENNNSIFAGTAFNSIVFLPLLIRND